jgi:nucleotide-binding universal stress UspA family protein
MKNILLLVHQDAGQEARLQAALDVTRAVKGHLRCVDIAQIPVAYVDIQSGAGAAMLLDDEVEREGRNRDELTRRLAGEDVSWNWLDVVGDFVEGISDQGALADLIVLNRSLDGPGPDMRGIVGTILLRTHKLVLAVPESLRRFNVCGRALVAWDDSKAASAALEAAIPLLKLASEARVLHVAKGGKEADAEPVATYLSRHGIKADLKQAYDEQHSVAQVITGEIARWGADWCLMGGYGHNRVRETVFGGVTHEMLGNSTVPLVLSH